MSDDFNGNAKRITLDEAIERVTGTVEWCKKNNDKKCEEEFDGLLSILLSIKEESKKNE